MAGTDITGTDITGTDITIVIVSYNSAHVIGDLLDSVPKAVGPCTAEVVVVDNGSSDGSVELLDHRADCRVIRSANVGYGAAINRGVKEARGTGAILVLNPDVRLGPEAAVRMLESLEAPGTGIVAPKILDAGGVLHYSLRREPTLPRALGLTFTRLPFLSEYVNRPSEYAEAHNVDWALGAVLTLSRQCFDALGGFDTTFFLYSEETDFCLRARAAGYETRYEPSATATHIGMQSGYSDNTHAMQIVNRVRLYRRRHGRAKSAIYMVLAMGSEGYRAVLGVRRSRHAFLALLIPGRRPHELHCAPTYVPS